MIAHTVQQHTVVTDFKHDYIDIATNDDHDYSCEVPVLQLRSRFFIRNQTTHVSHVEKSEALDDRKLYIYCLFGCVVLVQIVASFNQQKYVQDCEQIWNRKLRLRLYQLLAVELFDSL